MAYSENVASRIRKIIQNKKGFREQKMFGGLAFLLDGNMCIGILDDVLVARVGPEEYEKAEEKRWVRPFDFTGKTMRGFLYVHPRGYKTKKQLEKWVDMCITFVRTLPQNK